MISNSERERRISVPLKSGSKNSPRGGTKIYLLVPPEGDTEKPTIALMQEATLMLATVEQCRKTGRQGRVG